MPKVTLTEAQKEKERLQHNIEIIQGKKVMNLWERS